MKEARYRGDRPVSERMLGSPPNSRSIFSTCCVARGKEEEKKKKKRERKKKKKKKKEI